MILLWILLWKARTAGFPALQTQTHYLSWKKLHRLLGVALHKPPELQRCLRGTHSLFNMDSFAKSFKSLMNLVIFDDRPFDIATLLDLL